MDPRIFTCIKNGAPHTYRFPWKNFTHLLQHRAEHRGDHPAIVFRDLDGGARSVITYADLEGRTAAFLVHGDNGASEATDDVQ